MAMPPTITVDQGTPLKVYVQKDIVFPGRSANLTKVID
jgi:type IV secretory pathway VirB10-like protein